MLTKLRTHSRASLARVFGPNGIELTEALLVLAVLLLARGFWLFWQPGAYLAPALIILWIALPSRRVFVVRESETPRAPKRKR